MLTKIKLNIDDGDRLNPTKLSAQATAARKNIYSLTQALIDVATPIESLYKDTQLAGDSYTNIKSQINNYRAIINDIQTAVTTQRRDYKSVILKCEDIEETLDGTEINEGYSAAVESENANRKKAKEYQDKADSCWDILFITKFYYQKMAEHYTDLADNDVELAEAYIDKANSYKDFEDATKDFFQGFYNYDDTIATKLQTLLNNQSNLKSIMAKTGNFYNVIPGISNTYKSAFAKHYDINANLLSQITECDYDKFETDIEKFDKLYHDNYETYKAISDATGVPPELIALIHYRESGGNFNTYLHNGDPLGQKTTHEPKGLYFTDFKEAAIDALNKQKNAYNVSFEGGTDLATMLTFAEAFNGFGYSNNGHVSPYLYSGTNVYTSGKYVADSKYDPNAVDSQVGGYLLLKSLED